LGKKKMQCQRCGKEHYVAEKVYPHCFYRRPRKKGRQGPFEEALAKLSTTVQKQSATIPETLTEQSNIVPASYNGQREAKQLDPTWAKLLLRNFSSKYPKTGTPVQRPAMTCAPRRPRKNADNKHAAVIQQRLEFLLMQKKEEEALKEMMAKEGPLF
jgi:hypothetical protein